jgi:hypothetical protein
MCGGAWARRGLGQGLESSTYHRRRRGLQGYFALSLPGLQLCSDENTRPIRARMGQAEMRSPASPAGGERGGVAAGAVGKGSPFMSGGRERRGRR